MRILFMGTPDIAAECLKALYAAGHEICGVYTRRDKPVGRKQVLTAPPVKEVALEHGTPVFQPRTLRDGSEDENIRALAPELIVVVAYGCILPKSVLEMPRYGCINLHVSLLPKYRGSAPVQWSVLNGDAETGVSIMQMDEGLDTGDVLYCKKIAIDPEETSGELFDRVTAVGAEALCETIPQIAAGTLTAVPPSEVIPRFQAQTRCKGGAIHGLFALRHNFQQLDSTLAAGYGQGLCGQHSAGGFTVGGSHAAGHHLKFFAAACR